MSLFAKITRSYGTNATHVIFATTASESTRMTPVSSSTPRLLQTLISAGSNGIRSASLTSNERRTLGDLEWIGLRLDRRAGFVSLVGTVSVVDQRTFAREVA